MLAKSKGFVSFGMKKLNLTFKILAYVVLFSLFSCEKDLVSPPLIVESQILQLVNEHRASIKLKPLEMDAYITYECRAHCKDMADGTVPFGHDGFDKRTQRIIKEIGGGATGENVAFGQKSAKSVMDSWLNSPGHRANIEGNFTTIGIGAYQEGNGAIYYTQIFLKK